MDGPCHPHVQHTSHQTDPVLPAEGRSASPPAGKGNFSWTISKPVWRNSTYHQATGSTLHWTGALGRNRCRKELHVLKQNYRKEREKKAQTPATTTTYPCPHRIKLCGSRIGLYSHLKTTSRRPKREDSHTRCNWLPMMCFPCPQGPVYICHQSAHHLSQLPALHTPVNNLLIHSTVFQP